MDQGELPAGVLGDAKPAAAISYTALGCSARWNRLADRQVCTVWSRGPAGAGTGGDSRLTWDLDKIAQLLTGCHYKSGRGL